MRLQHKKGETEHFRVQKCSNAISELIELKNLGCYNILWFYHGRYSYLPTYNYTQQTLFQQAGKIHKMSLLICCHHLSVPAVVF